MMLTKSKTGIKTGEHADAVTGVDSLSKGSLISMGFVSAVIGIWAVACLVAAVVSSNGPLSLMQGWFSAFTGQ